MARARNLKPGFFKNEHLVQLPFATRLLFLGLATLADRRGRLEDRPTKIKMELFPADPVNVDEAIDQLTTAVDDDGVPLVIRYKIGDKKLLVLPNFLKHNNPHRDERESMILPPCGHSACMVLTECEHGNSTEVARLNPSSPTPYLLNPSSFSSENTPPPARANEKPKTPEIDPTQVPESTPTRQNSAEASAEPFSDSHIDPPTDNAFAGRNWTPPPTGRNTALIAYPAELDETPFRKYFEDSWIPYLQGRNRNAMPPTLQQLQENLVYLAPFGPLSAISVMRTAVSNNWPLQPPNELQGGKPADANGKKPYNGKAKLSPEERAARLTAELEAKKKSKQAVNDLKGTL